MTETGAALGINTGHTRSLQPDFPERLPVVHIAGVVMQQHVVLQIFRGSQRMLAGQQLGTADRRDGQRQQPVHIHIRIMSMAIKDGDIGIIQPGFDGRALGDINLAVDTDPTHASRNPNVNFMMCGDKTVQPRHQPARGK